MAKKVVKKVVVSEETLRKLKEKKTMSLVFSLLFHI